MRSQVSRVFWLRRRSERCHSQPTWEQEKEGEKHSTRRVEIQVPNDHILLEFGDWYVEAIRRADVLAWRDRASNKLGGQTRKPLSPATVNL